MTKKHYSILLSIALLLTSPLMAQNAGDNFFYSDQVHEIHLTFNQSNFLDSLHFYKQQGDSIGDYHYMLAGAEIDGNNTISIGARFKGNSSYNAPNEKKSFKLDFNEFVSGQQYDGLKKLNLNNAVNDPSFLREKLLLDYLDKHNIQGPRCTFSNVYVNGSYFGLYSTVEQVNKTFLEDHFGNKGGNLFKGDPQGKLTWKGTDPALYYGEYELKTNEDINDWSDLIYLIDQVNNTSAADFKDALNSVFNTSPYLKSWAVNMLFVSLDSYIGSAHNYYIYHNSFTDQFDWITWDANGSFGLFNVAMTEEALKDLSVLYVKNPLSSPLNANILANTDLKNEYLNNVALFLADDFNPGYFYPQIDSLADKIRAHVYADTMKTFSNQQFEDNINYTSIQGPNKTIPALKDFLAARIAAVENELALLGVEVGMNDQYVKRTISITNYPNPFSSSTTISYHIPETGNIELIIYDFRGREITTLVNNQITAGDHSVVWSASQSIPGIYFCKIKLDGGIVQTKKLVVVR